jgi:hypothetical protein
MECPHCGAANKPESRFCGECGEALGKPKWIACPMCDTLHPPGITECSQCGARLLPPGVSLSEVPLEPLRPAEQSAASTEDEGAVAQESDLGEGEIAKDVDIAEKGVGETVPPWVRKLETTPVGGSAEEDLGAEGIERGELPDWLEVPPDFEQLLSEAAQIADEEGVAPAEIPPWLEALRPEPEAGAEASAPAGSPTEVAGLLRGVRGTLGIEPILAIPRRSVPVEPVAPSTAAQERAELFGAVVREPARPGITIARPRRVEKLAASSARWMMYLIVAAAAVVPILLGSKWSEANMSVSGGTAAMYEAIEGLPQGAVVLVSHDYDPGVAGEMIPQARAVLNHLLERGAHVISVSLTPEGARLSARLFDEVAVNYGYAEGQGYETMGYVVGVEAGPCAVVEALSTAGWSDVVGGVKDIALIVEFAGAPEYLRLWLEQVQGPYGIPMVAGVSATVDPFARPYHRNEASRQLLGLMTGLVGAAEYERLSGQAGPALAGMDSQSVAHIAIVLLILVGNVAYFGGRLRGRKGG